MYYTFEIHFTKYNRKNAYLDDTKAIYVNNICIIAKNNKFGQLYLNKDSKIISGKFLDGAGSNSYPILYTKNKVIIQSTSKEYPILNIDNIEHKSHIQILNIKENGRLDS